MPTRSAIILAAGYGSRLDADEGHKLVAQIGSRPLLSYHLDNFSRLGVEEVIVVTGFEANVLAEAVADIETPENMTVRCVPNEDFDGPNGLSVLTGVDALEDDDGQVPPFWLTMSDHLFSPDLFDDLAARFDRERPPRWQGALIVDYKLDTIFDMPDATKIRTDDADFAIGKELVDFDAVDCGLFWCAPGFVDALRQAKSEHGGCSTSDGVEHLYREGHFGLWDIGEELWQDVDTPGARAHAEKLVARGFAPGPAPKDGA